MLGQEYMPPPANRPLRPEPEVLEQACYRLTTKQPKPGLKYCHENNEVQSSFS